MSYYTEIIPGVYTSMSLETLAEFDRMLEKEWEKLILFGEMKISINKTTQTPTESIPQEEPNSAVLGQKSGSSHK
jgi:hypothetical protein